MTALGSRTVLAVDPGSSKCGMALVNRSEDGQVELLWRAVVPSAEVATTAQEAAGIAEYSMVVVGAGTRSREVVDRLREALPATALLLVDEKNTSLQARERYWVHNPRRGWRRLLPATLQTPPEPVDDFVALILAERVLRA